MNALISKLNAFQPRKILVIGDIMLDHYEYGTSERRSQESPAIPVVDINREEWRLGGAANTASNIKALGCEPYLLGVVGGDEKAEKVHKLLKEKEMSNAIIPDLQRPTTLKRRTFITSEHTQPHYCLRVDKEKREDLSKDIEEKIKEAIARVGRDIDAVVISDYAKGVVTKSLYDLLLEKAQEKNLPVIIDPHPVHAHLYRNATMIKPNDSEAQDMARRLTGRVNNGDILSIGKFLKEQLNSGILISLGRKGMSLFYGDLHQEIPTQAREVFDVTGAGDTVVAAFTAGYTNKLSAVEAAYFANCAAGISVEKHGTYAVSLKEILERLDGKK